MTPERLAQLKRLAADGVLRDYGVELLAYVEELEAEVKRLRADARQRDRTYAENLEFMAKERDEARAEVKRLQANQTLSPEESARYLERLTVPAPADGPGIDPDACWECGAATSKGVCADCEEA